MAGQLRRKPAPTAKGKPCRRCGYTIRYVSGNRCVGCTKADNLAWNRRNADTTRAARTIWARANRAYMTASAARYRAAKIRATPAWLTDEQNEQIRATYDEAARLTRETGVPHQVDHIVPLRGKKVCGMHVPWNLQILTATENVIKGNRLGEI